MSLYHSTDAQGVSLVNPSKEQMQSLIDSLDEPEIEEAEYPDISLTHNASGWSITLFPSGVATMENLEDDDKPPCYLSELTRKQALDLWKLLAKGDFVALSRFPWRTDD